MKKRIIIILLLAVAANTLRAQVPQDWKGRWWEAYLDEAMLPLNLSMENALSDWRNANAESAQNAISVIQQMTGESGEAVFNEVYPVLYSPLQTAMGMQPTQCSFRNDTLRYEQAQVGIKMVLVYNDSDSSLSGTFRQGMKRIPIHFTPCDTLSHFNRPQTPQPPFSFIPEQVTLSRKDKEGREVVLSGTLAIPYAAVGPDGKQPKFPAVLLVSGSGQQNRDEDIMLHKPFLVIAEYFARQGIATLRYDDRGVGESKGDVATATTLDFADDAEAMFQLLRNHERIDKHHVGILGHSEGGAIAPIVAARNKKVDFVVMMAGQGCTGGEVLLQQNEAIFHTNGVPDSLVQIRLQCMKAFFDTMPHISNDQYLPAFSKIIATYTDHLSKEDQKLIGMRKNDAFLWSQQLQMPWMQTFVTLDPSTYLPKVKCPILAIGGDKDVQVLVLPNLAAVRRWVSRDKQLTTIKYPNLNHLFQHCQDGNVKEYLYLEETMDTDVLKDMADWIRLQIHK